MQNNETRFTSDMLFCKADFRDVYTKALTCRNFYSMFTSPHQFFFLRCIQNVVFKIDAKLIDF